MLHLEQKAEQAEGHRGGFEVLRRFPGRDREACGFFEAFVCEPEDVEAGLVTIEKPAVPISSSLLRTRIQGPNDGLSPYPALEDFEEWRSQCRKMHSHDARDSASKTFVN